MGDCYKKPTDLKDKEHPTLETGLIKPEEEDTKNKELVKVKPREPCSFPRWQDGGHKMLVRYTDCGTLALEARHEDGKIISLSQLTWSPMIRREEILRLWSIQELGEIESPGLKIQEAATSDWQWRERILEDDTPSKAARTMQPP